MTRSFPRAASRASAALVAAALTVAVALASPASASPDPSSTPENYTFTAERTIVEGDPSTIADDITTFTYTLTAAPDTDGGAGISHAVVAAFCVTPIGYTAEDFEDTDPSTGDVGVKTGELTIGDTLSFQFAGDYGVDPTGARILIKQGNDARTVTVPGPACPTPPPVCGSGEVLNGAGDACVPVCGSGEVLNGAGDACVPVCGSGEVLDDAGDACVPVCGSGEVLNDAGDACVPVCGSGEVLNDAGDACVPKAVVCTDGQQLVEGVCTTPIVPVVPVIDVPVVTPVATCPDGTVMTDRDGDQQLTEADCAEVLPDSGAAPTPAEPVPSVLPGTVVPTAVPAVAPVASPAPTPTEAVLGSHVTRTAALPRTGSSSVGLAAFGALLLLLGASASVAGRRTARS